MYVYVRAKGGSVLVPPLVVLMPGSDQFIIFEASASTTCSGRNEAPRETRYHKASTFQVIHYEHLLLSYRYQHPKHETQMVKIKGLLTMLY